MSAFPMSPRIDLYRSGEWDPSYVSSNISFVSQNFILNSSIPKLDSVATIKGGQSILILITQRWCSGIFRRGRLYVVSADSCVSRQNVQLSGQSQGALYTFPSRGSGSVSREDLAAGGAVLFPIFMALFTDAEKETSHAPMHQDPSNRETEHLPASPSRDATISGQTAIACA